MTPNNSERARAGWLSPLIHLSNNWISLAGVVLVLLAVPALGLPQLRQNFDVLNELPSGAESRQGFDTLSQHLAQGQLMPLTVLVKVPGNSATVFTSEQGLADIGEGLAAATHAVTYPPAAAARTRGRRPTARPR